MDWIQYVGSTPIASKSLSHVGIGQEEGTSEDIGANMCFGSYNFLSIGNSFRSVSKDIKLSKSGQFSILLDT